MGYLKNFLRKRFFKELWFERFLRNHKWCLKEQFFGGTLRHLYRFFEELFKEMVY